MAQTKSTHKSTELGTKPIGKLLASQAIPAAIGILIVSLYMIVDTIFVGRFVDPLGIGALTVVMPITFLIASVGMAIGVGSASIISRALGANDPQHARHTFAHYGYGDLHRRCNQTHSGYPCCRQPDYQ